MNIIDIWQGIDDESLVKPLDWHNFVNFLIGQGKTGSPLICLVLSGHKYGQPVISPIFDQNAMSALYEFCENDSVTTQLLNDALWGDVGKPNNGPSTESVDEATAGNYILRQETMSQAHIDAVSYLIASASEKHPELIPYVSSGPELLFDTLVANFNASDISMIVYSRRIVGLKENTHLPVCKNYCDSDSESPPQFCQSRLKNFHEKILNLSSEVTNRLNIELKISELNGVNCERHTKFKSHVAEGGYSIYHAVKECRIVRNFRKKSLLACVTGDENKTNRLQMLDNALDSLVREGSVHLLYAHHHANECTGRDDFLNRVLHYVTSHEGNSTTFCKPLAILGSAGSGQTSLMSKLVLHLIEHAFPADSNLVIIPRFANLTPESSDLKQILRHLLLHLAYIVGGSARANRELNNADDVASIKNRFINELQTMKQGIKVVFLIDGLESLQSNVSSGYGDFIDWLPSVLSDRVRVVVTLKKNNEESVTHFAARYDESCLLDLQDFTPEQANELLKDAFNENNQQPMFTHWQALRTALDSYASNNNGGVPACYLSLLKEAALRWHSFTVVSPSYFGYSVEEELNRVFSLCEIRNGETFTKHTLAYLTATKNRGISLSELADVLSLDNFVLHAIGGQEKSEGEKQLQHFNLAIARVPILALYRLLFEVNSYLSQRTVDGIAVIIWADGVLSKFAEKRYLLADTDLNRTICSNLAEYYLGSWAGKTPKDLRLSVCDSIPKKSASTHSPIFSLGKAVRFVVRQPLAFADCRTPGAADANVRKLNCLPYYFLASGRFKDLCNYVLFNLEWLLAKISSSGVDKTLRDFNVAMGIIKNNAMATSSDEIALVRDAIRFSRSILSIKPHLLGGLLLARLLVFLQTSRLAPLHRNMCNLLVQCDAASASDVKSSLLPVLSFLDTPGSPMIYMAKVSRLSPMIMANSPLNVIPLQTNYNFVLGFKLEASKTAKFWSACNCGNSGPNWFCPPVPGLPEGPFFQVNARGNRLFATLIDKQTLQLYHVESGELVYEVHLSQQIEIKQLTSTDRFLVIVPGLTTVQSSTTQKQVTIPTGPIVVDMLHRAVAHRFSVRPDMTTISSDNDYFAFSVDEMISIYQFPLMECVCNFRTEMPPAFLYLIPHSVHGRSEDIRMIVITNHGSVLLAMINKKMAKAVFKPVLPYRENLVNPVLQVDTRRGGATGLLESPGRLFVIGLRDGSLIEDFQPPAQVPSPRRFTASAFACGDHMVAGALSTGHICLFRIGDRRALKMISPTFQSTIPITDQIITHLYGPSCCSCVVALSTNGEETYLRCWDVQRLSSQSYIAEHNHVVSPGKIVGVFPPTPLASGIGDPPMMSVAVLSIDPQENVGLQMFNIHGRTAINIELTEIDFNHHVIAQVTVSPDGLYCFVMDTNQHAVLYSLTDNGKQSIFEPISAFSQVNDAFFSLKSDDKVFESVLVVVTRGKLISTYLIAYGKLSLKKNFETEMVKDAVFFPNTRTLCFLTAQPNPGRAKDDIKMAIIQDVVNDSSFTSKHLYEIWPSKGCAHWEFSKLMPIPDEPNQVLTFFTVAEAVSFYFSNFSSYLTLFFVKIFRVSLRILL